MLRSLQKPARVRRTRLAVFLAGILLTGCSLLSSTLPKLPPASSERYLLGSGDRIRVNTYGDDSLSGEHLVGDNGTIAIPLVGNLRAAGLTADELALELSARLKDAEILSDPKVAVEVLSYRPIFILGEVAKPGQYDYQPGMSIVTAVAIAGGFNYRAVKDEFSVVRTVNGQSIEGRADRQTKIEPGDVITVYERFF